MSKPASDVFAHVLPPKFYQQLLQLAPELIVGAVMTVLEATLTSKEREQIMYLNFEKLMAGDVK